MLVRDRGAGMWQLVRQPDHADLSGQFARAWGGAAVSPVLNTQSLQLATTRHDDGWAVYDRRPGWDPEKKQPRALLDVPVRSHLAFYRACIQVVSEEDSYAGLMISMHGAGIYRGRYGTKPSTGLHGIKDYPVEVQEFVEEQEALHAAWKAELGADEAEIWGNYKLLEIYDRLSLSLCLLEWEGSDAEGDTIGPCPIDYQGTDVDLRLEPLGPWRVRMDPFPFAETPARFTLARKLMPHVQFRGNDDFRDAYFGTRAEVVQITVER